jgi:hypothetical protein
LVAALREHAATISDLVPQPVAEIAHLSLLVNRLKADFSFAGVSMQPSDTAVKSSDH